MKILFLTHRVPFPPDKGDRIRSYNIIKFLAKSHHISLMSITHEPVHANSYEVLRQYCSTVDIFRIDPRLNKLKSCFYMLTKRPLTLPLFYSREFHKALKPKLLEKEFDLIYIYSSPMAQYVLDIGDIPKLMDFIDVDSQKWFDYSERSSSIMRYVYHREGIRLRSFERRVASICDQNIFVSDKETEVFKSFASTVPVMALPNGVDVPQFKPNGLYRENKVVFVGVMDYLPNIDAMIYFTEEILPLIKKVVPNIELSIVGRNPPRQIKELGRLDNVTVTGCVDEVKPHLYDAAVSVIPLRVARGMHNKILEAMAHGVPVITTTCALDGIEAKPGRDVLVADDPYHFAEKTVAVLKDRILRNMLAANALALVKRKYSWEENLKALDEAVRGICKQL